MKLELENGTEIENPSAEQIESALRTLVEEGGGFAILSDSEQVYIQVAANAEDDCNLEYREGSEESHFCCTADELHLKNAIQAFQEYGTGNDDWKNRFGWRPLYGEPETGQATADLQQETVADDTSPPEGKPGCLGVLLVVIAGWAIGIAAI